MKIDISKPHREKVSFEYPYNSDGVESLFSGFYKKDGQFLVLDGFLSGKVKVTCDISGKEFYDLLQEEIKVKFISGIYNGFDEKYDIIELDSDVMDLDAFLSDEIEAFRLGFHKDDDAENQFELKEI